MIVGEADILIHANTASFQRDLEAQTAPGLSNLERNAEGAGARAGSKLAAGLKIGAAAFLATGALALDLGSKYQSATATIAANADIQIGKAKQIGDAFLTTAGHSIFSAQTIAASYGPVAGQLGAVEGHALDAGQALKFMSDSQTLAEATGGQLGSTTADLTGILQAYHLSLGQASGATDVLFNTSRVTGISVDTLTGVLERLHSKLGDLSPSLAESGGLLASLANNGVTGRGAMTALNGSFTTLLGGSKATSDTAKELGINIYNSSGQFVGMKSIITQLSPVLGEYNEKSQLAITKALFGAPAQKQLLQVILDGPKAYDAATAAVSKHGSAEDAAQKQSQTFGHQVDVLKATAVDLGIKLSSILLPAVQTVASAFVAATGFLATHQAALIAVATVVGGVLTTAFTVFTVNKLIAFKNGIVDAKNAVESLATSMSTKLQSAFSSSGTSADTTKGKIAGVGSASTVAASDVSAASTKIEGDNATAGASYTTLGTDAEAGAGKAGLATDTLATTVTAKDGIIEGDNVAAGLSFSALIPIIGAVVLAAEALKSPLQGLSQDISNATGGAIGTGYSGPQLTNAQAHAEANKEAKANPWFGSAASLYAQIKSSGQIKGTPASTNAMVSGPGFGSGAALTGNSNPTAFAQALAKNMGLPPSAIPDLVAWEKGEGGAGPEWGGNNSANFNPLNTTLPEAGSTTFQSVGPGATGIRQYQSWSQGLQATIATLQGYPSIIQALKSGASPSTFANLVDSSPWGTHDLTAQSVLDAGGSGSTTTPGTKVFTPTSTSTATTPVQRLAAEAARKAAAARAAEHKRSVANDPNPDVVGSGASGVGAQAANNVFSGIATGMVGAAQKMGTTVASNITTLTKSGQTEQASLVKAATNTNLGTLTTELNATHQAKMSQVVSSLNATHNTALMKMATVIEGDWKAALAQQTKLQNQATATAMGNADTITGDQAKAKSDAIAAASALAVDQLNGASPQQIALDQQKQTDSGTIDSDQTAYDTAQQGGDPLAIAAAHQQLANDQANAEVVEAQKQAAVDLSNAAANLNGAAATVASANNGATFNIYTNDPLTAAAQVGWQLTVGTVPGS